VNTQGWYMWLVAMLCVLVVYKTGKDLELANALVQLRFPALIPYCQKAAELMRTHVLVDGKWIVKQ